MDFGAAKEYVIRRLREELDPLLTYHCLEHTLDVIESTAHRAEAEHAGAEATRLLLTAALYHDTGMLIRYQDHETASAELARQTLPGFGYTEPEIREIIRLILVTRLPQLPEDHAGEIICDADLDYLGRDDYFYRAFQLQVEWNRFGIRKTDLKEWLSLQVHFLEEHHYFTQSAVGERQQGKLRHLEEMRRLCGSREAGS